MKYWEIIADNLSKGGWSRGCVSAIDSRGRTIWIVDAHRDDGRRFIVRADEKLTAFLELESVVRGGRIPLRWWLKKPTRQPLLLTSLADNLNDRCVTRQMFIKAPVTSRLSS
jgi:hypothetical protein